MKICDESNNVIVQSSEVFHLLFQYCGRNGKHRGPRTEHLSIVPFTECWNKYLNFIVQCTSSQNVNNS